MDDFTPNDPLWKLLGQAKPVETRGSFAQNVLRLARQTPQDTGLWARLRGWWSDSADAAWHRPALIGATAAVLTGLVIVGWPKAAVHEVETIAAAAVPSLEFSASGMDFITEDASAPLASLDHMDELLASQDTSSLSDSDIALLLY
jgi:hypothetical protein